MIKGTPTISTLCDFHIKVALYHQKSKDFLHWMLRQGADPLGVKKVLVKMINRHALQFKKYNASNRYLIQQLLT